MATVVLFMAGKNNHNRSSHVDSCCLPAVVSVGREVMLLCTTLCQFRHVERVSKVGKGREGVLGHDVRQKGDKRWTSADGKGRETAESRCEMMRRQGA